MKWTEKDDKYMNKHFQHKRIVESLETRCKELKTKANNLYGHISSYKETIASSQKCVGELKQYNHAKSVRIKELEAEVEQLKGFCKMKGLDDLQATITRMREALIDYGQHESKCIRSQWTQGRITKDGGYETLYGHSSQSKWYRDDDLPVCSCGLDAAFTQDKEGGSC